MAQPPTHSMPAFPPGCDATRRDHKNEKPLNFWDLSYSIGLYSTALDC